ncbi:unnamed protein product [Clonostachys rosea]|uniref:Uncharacterized protein n=1 Tax=Bionectria ochroleuca TaxID=29856 RepID=A0ABY6TZR9_BIOOC|nr:unnamed protein product [Clonostachys rosea]
MTSPSGSIRTTVTAARLDDEVSRIRESKFPVDDSALQDIHDRIRILQNRISETKIPPSHTSIPELRFGMLGNSALDAHNFKLSGQVYPGNTQFEAICTAEIFRLALHIYVARIIYDPLTTGNSASEIRAWVTEALELLPKVSDTIGPGIFLGWALVVIGSEVDNISERNFIKQRLQSLELLAFNQGATAIRVLEEVWGRKDSVKRGDAVGKKTRWQEVMLNMAVDIALM